LVEILEAAGLDDVKTYIQSGNAVFRCKRKQATELTDEISQLIQQRKGFLPKLLLLKKEEFQAAANANPFPSDGGKLLHLFFLYEKSTDPDLESLAAVQSSTEDFRLINKVFYLYAPDGIGRSKLVAKIDKAMKVPVTARNWNTIRKLLSMLETM
ncbi:MAG: DUF1697 domain-containing protein, partial [Proteobacteria bacterium]|nr:DUF1697 domain-containing protein [Pseudomonadota bacterium]